MGFGTRPQKRCPGCLGRDNTRFPVVEFRRESSEIVGRELGSSCIDLRRDTIDTQQGRDFDPNL